jgi:hypothetical protein
MSKPRSRGVETTARPQTAGTTPPADMAPATTGYPGPGDDPGGWTVEDIRAEGRARVARIEGRPVPFRVVEGESLCYFNSLREQSLDDVISEVVEAHDGGLRAHAEGGRAGGYSEATSDLAIWRMDEHGRDRLLAVVRPRRDGTAEVIRMGDRP